MNEETEIVLLICLGVFFFVDIIGTYVRILRFRRIEKKLTEIERFVKDE